MEHKLNMAAFGKSSVILTVMLVFFTAVAGRPQSAGLPLKTVVFKGKFHLAQSELLNMLPLKVNHPLMRGALTAKIRRFEQTLHDNGYLYAKVDSFRTTLTSDSSAISLTIFGSSGQRFRLGKISLKSDSLAADLYAQQISLRRGDFYQAQKIRDDIQQMLVYAANNGYPFAEVTIDGLYIRKDSKQMTVDVLLSVHEHHKIYIQDIIVKGNVYTRAYVVLRELDIAPGMVYSERAIAKIPARLNRLNIFKNIGQPDIIKTAEDSVYIIIPVTEGNAATFDGVVGYIPAPRQELSAGSKGYFTGLLNVAYKNLFGTARKFAVHWQKPDQLSEEFSFSYLEPWVLNYPVNLATGLERTVRDTTYIEWSVHLRSEFRLTHNVSLIAAIKKRSVIPDSAASMDARLPQSSSLDGEVGIVYDTRDSRNNPRSGMYYKSSYVYGLKKNSGPAYLIQQDSLLQEENLHSLLLDAEGYLNFWGNQVLSLAVHLRQIKGRKLTLSDYFWFGGSRSLRGYRENQFNGNLVAWLNLEYRFLTGKNSRLFVFSDGGYYQNNLNGFREEWLYGYGLGLRMDTPLGVLGVDYGLGRGDSFSQGKIHFGLINSF